MMVTSNVQAFSFPCLSTPVYVTVVVPRKKVASGWCESCTVTAPALSVKTGSVQFTLVETDPTSAGRVMLLGQPVNVGGSLSVKR